MSSFGLLPSILTDIWISTASLKIERTYTSMNTAVRASKTYTCSTWSAVCSSRLRLAHSERGETLDSSPGRFLLCRPLRGLLI